MNRGVGLRYIYIQYIYFVTVTGLYIYTPPAQKVGRIMFAQLLLVQRLQLPRQPVHLTTKQRHVLLLRPELEHRRGARLLCCPAVAVPAVLFAVHP